MGGGPAVTLGTPAPIFSINCFGSGFTRFGCYLFPVGLTTGAIARLPIGLAIGTAMTTGALALVLLLGGTIASPVSLLSTVEALIIRFG